MSIHDSVAFSSIQAIVGKQLSGEDVSIWESSCVLWIEEAVAV